MKQHDAAEPQEKCMTRPFKVAEDGKVAIFGAQIQECQFLVSADSLAIKPNAGDTEAEKADLLERRLRRIELALGIDPTPESTAALEAALRQF